MDDAAMKAAQSRGSSGMKPHYLWLLTHFFCLTDDVMCDDAIDLGGAWNGLYSYP